MKNEQKATLAESSTRTRVARDTAKKMKGQTNWASLVAEERKERTGRK